LVLGELRSLAVQGSYEVVAVRRLAIQGGVGIYHHFPTGTADDLIRFAVLRKEDIVARTSVENISTRTPDVWPAHVYFDGDAFVGFVDFESLVSAPPVLDLAQLIGHFGGWDAREDALRAYERIAPLETRCRATLPLEIVADLAGEGIWSLQALCEVSPSERTRAEREAHALNLGVLLGCLEGAAREAEMIRG
jgi:hypothetical protein